MSDPTTSKSKVDPFWLEKIFDKPDALFAFKCRPVEQIAGDSVFALDANALLAPYQIGSQSVAELETIYKRLASSNRLFAPAQAVREYARNRARKVADVYEQIHSRISSAPNVLPLNCPMLKEYNHILNCKRPSPKYAR